MLISPAYAQAAGGTSGLIGLTPFILLFVIFYFLLIRPQQKKMKAHKAMLDAIRRGDRIVTNGGIVGLVTKVLPDERALMVEIADNIKVKVMRDMVSTVMSKTEPVSADKDDADDSSKDK